MNFFHLGMFFFGVLFFHKVRYVSLIEVGLPQSNFFCKTIIS